MKENGQDPMSIQSGMDEIKGLFFPKGSYTPRIASGANSQALTNFPEMEGWMEEAFFLHFCLLDQQNVRARYTD